MSTAENNKLIAEFMGVSIEDNNIIVDFDKHPNNFHHTLCVFEGVANSPIYELDERVFKFHCSWDWLMPVVEKILEGTHDNSFKIGNKWCFVRLYHAESNYSNLDCGSYEGDYFENSKIKYNRTIDCVYKAVVEFIKWYNENNKQRNL